MSIKTLKLEASMEGVNTLKSGELSIRFHTQELTPEEKVVAMEYVNTFGWLLFKQNEFQEGDIPKESAEEDLTPSQRLRRVLYVYWQQLGEPDDFEKFYRQRMEKISEAFKNKLENE